jgi:hypothetical protein
MEITKKDCKEPKIAIIRCTECGKDQTYKTCEMCEELLFESLGNAITYNEIACYNNGEKHFHDYCYDRLPNGD